MKLLSKILISIFNTHKNPANRLLHFVGMPFYFWGIAIAVSDLIGLSSGMVAMGIIMWIAAVGMFLGGHYIEGNLRSAAPLVIIRILRRKSIFYFLKN